MTDKKVDRAEEVAQRQREIEAEELRRQFLLGQIRCAALRAKLLLSDIELVGTSLSNKMITAEQAAVWLHQCGALSFFLAEQADRILEQNGDPKNTIVPKK